MSKIKKTLIVGLGSPYGDDQLGWLIIDELTKLQTTPSGLTLFKSKNNGSDWFHEINNHQQVIFIDAVLSKEPIGTIIEITVDNLNKLASNRSSTHSVSLGDSISLAMSLDFLKVPVRIIGISIEQDNHFAKISDELIQIIPKLQQQLSSQVSLIKHGS